MKALLRSLAPALLVVLALAGCSSPSSDPSPSPAVPTPSGPTQASTLPPRASTPVPAPTPGSTAETEAPKPVQTKAPVRVGATAQATSDVAVVVTKLDAIEAKAQGPGEVSGPALAVKVEIRNGTREGLSLSGAVVSLTASDGSPGGIMSASPTSPFPASVGAGKTASGTFVFAIAEDKRDPVRLDVTVSPSLAVVAFRGQAPR